MNLKKLALAVVCAGGAMAATVPAQAANWLMLQGTEPDSAAGRAKVWGFIQGQMQWDTSEANAAGAFIPPKLVGPNLTSQKTFNVNRARIGVRGQNFPLDSKTNYFILAEFGNNAITAPNNGVARVTDASVTFNHIPFARIRAGLFKTPGAEEGLQAIHVFDYNNFTWVTNQLLLERFPNTDLYGGPVNPTDPRSTGVAPNGFDKPVGAFRDVGVQLFDTVTVKNWEFAYAGMIGNGNGVNFSDVDNQKDIYGYLSAEQVYGGKGGRREGLKLFAWYQTGKRTVDTNSNQGAVLNKLYSRTRYGAGVKYLKKPLRVSAEYMAGEGMIFLGPHKQNFDMNAMGGVGSGLEGTAHGYYLDVGFYIPKTKAEVDARYDVYNRLIDDPLQVNYSTITLGAQYHLNKKTRVAANYEIRSASSEEDVAALEANFEGLKDRISVQFTAIF